MEKNTQYIDEDKIDLRELFAVLRRRKKLIWGMTALLTLLALVYVFVAKPVYEIKAVMEMAQIDKKPVQNITDLKQKIEVVFEVNVKGKKIEFPIVSDVIRPKKTTNLIIVKAQGYDNDTAQQKLQEVFNYIKSVQEQELNSYSDIQKKSLALVEHDITRNEQLSIEIKKDIDNYEKKLLNISEQDAALAGIYAIETGRKQSEVNRISTHISYLKNKRLNLQLSISPLKIQKTALIGKMEVVDKPIKPKKKLIVIVAFITGLMLSVFLAFFLEFIGGMKKEEEESRNRE